MISQNKIKNIYSKRLPESYDKSLIFNRYRNNAIKMSDLKKGDKVIVFCCGTGLDFYPILDKIGTYGEIVGVDFSKTMLEQAGEKVLYHNWKNVKLVESDIKLFDYTQFFNEPPDAIVCTLGLSIIPDYESAYKSLLKNVKRGGEIIIGDLKYNKGLMSIFNLLALFIASPYGGSVKGHKNSITILESLKNDTANLQVSKYLFFTYYIALGKKV